jgi:hypothetical protein
MPAGTVRFRMNTFFDEKGRNTEAEFWLRKSRFEELGYPTRLKMTYDPQAAVTGRASTRERPVSIACRRRHE